jgi:hypothetical protein
MDQTFVLNVAGAACFYPPCGVQIPSQGCELGIVTGLPDGGALKVNVFKRADKIPERVQSDDTCRSRRGMKRQVIGSTEYLYPTDRRGEPPEAEWCRGPDGPVLVVGGGNSGFQIAEELARWWRHRQKASV